MKLSQQGIDPNLIGTHFLQAGGTMTLNLHGYSDTTIQKMGRLDIYHLDAIHPQLPTSPMELQRK